MKNKVKFPDKYSDEFVKFLDETFIIEDVKVFDYLDEDNELIESLANLKNSEENEMYIKLYLSENEHGKILSYSLEVHEDAKINQVNIIDLNNLLFGKKTEDKTVNEIEYNAFSQEELDSISADYLIYMEDDENYLKYKNRDFIEMLLEISNFTKEYDENPALGIFPNSPERDIIVICFTNGIDKKITHEEYRNFVIKFNQYVEFMVRIVED